jgi:hypothetical protein
MESTLSLACLANRHSQCNAKDANTFLSLHVTVPLSAQSSAQSI